jgi:hypothetical protein
MNATPFKIDILRPLSTKRLQLSNSQDTYEVDFGTDSGSGNMKLKFQVREAVEKIGARGKDGPHRWQFTDPDKGATAQKIESTAAAKTYLEQFNLLNLVQEMLQFIIREKPADPLVEMAKYMCKISGYAAKEGLSSSAQVIEQVAIEHAPEVQPSLVSQTVASNVVPPQAQVLAKTPLDESRLKVAEALFSSLEAGNLNEFLQEAKETDAPVVAAQEYAAVKIQSFARGKADRAATSEKRKQIQQAIGEEKSCAEQAPIIASGEAGAEVSSIEDVAALLTRQNQRLDEENKRMKQDISKLSGFLEKAGAHLVKDTSPCGQGIVAGTAAPMSGLTFEEVAAREKLACRNLELRCEHEALKGQLGEFCSGLVTLSTRLAEVVMKPSPGYAADVGAVEEQARAANSKLQQENEELRKLIDAASTAAEAVGGTASEPASATTRQ